VFTEFRKNVAVHMQ